MQAREPAVAFADGGSHGFDDDGIPHALLLVRTSTVKPLRCEKLEHVALVCNSSPGQPLSCDSAEEVVLPGIFNARSVK